MTKYEKINSIIKNGDICEFKTWDDKIAFGMYMDGYIYKDQACNFITTLGGYEQFIVAIRRPACIRNSFQCFKYGELYNYDYTKFGSFLTVYSE